MIDSYEALISEYISKEDFFRYGLEKTIYIPEDKVKLEWEALKKRINSNKIVYMRGFKDSASTHITANFYKLLFKNEYVKKDPSNTQNPAKIIEELSGYKKSKDLRNYQLSTIFGRSRNILAFTAPWNIVYIPSIFDPLLSVEAKGELATEYQNLFQRHSYEKFKPYIDEFNKMVTNHHFVKDMDEYFQRLFSEGLFEQKDMINFETIFREEFSPIEFS